MQRILRGARAFRASTFEKNRDLYQKLSKGQNPDAMFITCADSRIVPSQLTQTGPGELFIVRNAGNLVAPAGGGSTGEAASLEFAVLGLRIPDIIVCGHTECGAIKYLVQSQGGFPLLDDWVKNADEVIKLVGSEKAQEARLSLAYRQNVLLQVRNLLSYPFVSEAVKQGKLRLHGWLYDISSGEILAGDLATETFEPLSGGKQ